MTPKTQPSIHIMERRNYLLYTLCILRGRLTLSIKNNCLKFLASLFLAVNLAVRQCTAHF
jgi:hypothetical protein